MKKSKFSIAHKDEEMLELAGKTPQKTLAIWAIDCVLRVMPMVLQFMHNRQFIELVIPRMQMWLLSTNATGNISDCSNWGDKICEE